MVVRDNLAIKIRVSRVTREYLSKLKEKKGYTSLDFKIRKIIKEWVEFKKKEMEKEQCG